MSIAEELQKLQQLHQSGALDDAEFTLAKSKLLGTLPRAEPLPAAKPLPAADPLPPPLPQAIALDPASIEQETRQWAMLLHLSILAGYPLVLVGFIAPILIWQLKKAELPGIDVHGKNALNWIISYLIYGLACTPLFFVIIGFPLLVVLIAFGIAFPIIAGIKASQGEVWKYPLAITFLK